MKCSALADLLNYIDFLRSLGYYVAISGLGNRYDPFMSELSNYEVHLHSICFYLKQNKKTIGKCALNKTKLNYTEITKPIYSCCYAGIEEFVFPVFYEGECLLRINVSGYRGTIRKSEKFMQRISRLCDSDFAKYYAELSPTPPSLDAVEKFIKPIEYMAIELYNVCKDLSAQHNKSMSASKQIYTKATQYIDNNYMEPISCHSLSSKLNYSISYLEYIFKKEGNISVKAYINNTRLNASKHLLLHTDAKITDVAFSCGFSDSNYFSSAFKSKYGVSPKKFRAAGIDT